MTGAAPDLIAHRGFAGAYPENTVAAAQAAAEDADAIEVDAMPTADGDVVAFHDDRLGAHDRDERGLTDATGVVWETDTETVTSARVLGTDETVPLLSEVLGAVPSDVRINVELKNPGSFDLAFAQHLGPEELEARTDVWRPFVADVLAVVDDHDHDVLFSSFYEAALAAVREASDRAIAPITWNSAPNGLAIARRHDAEAIHPRVDAIPGTPFFGESLRDWLPFGDGPDLVAAAHEEGREVNVYTVTTWHQAHELAQAGVDGLIADYPGVLAFASSG